MTAAEGPDRVDVGAGRCPGGSEAHEAHMDVNGDCPWCGSYDRSKWVPCCPDHFPEEAS